MIIPLYGTGGITKPPITKIRSITVVNAPSDPIFKKLLKTYLFNQ